VADLSFVKTSAGLVPHTEHDKEVFDKWKVGGVISGEFKQVRNPKFHRKFFGLLNLAFNYYEPSSGVLTADEKRIATKIFVGLEDMSEGTGAFLDWGREFMKAESDERKGQIENIQCAFDPFRYDMIEKAGYYTTVNLPSGGTKRVAKSISFAKMDQLEFDQLYKAVFNTLWRFVLSRTFKDKQEAEQAAINMLNFA